MGRKCDGVVLPDYYTGPTWRPNDSPFDTPAKIAWDQLETWQTTAEWLAWVRRRDGKKTLWDGRRWAYPMRPIINGTRHPWSTRKLRKLP